MAGLLTLTEINQQQADLVDEIDVIDKACQEEKRQPTEDETKSVKELEDKFELLEQEKPRARRREEIRAQIKGENVGTPIPLRMPAQPKDVENEKRFGFKDWRDFLQNVITSNRRRQPDNRLVPLIVDAAGADEQSTISDPYMGFLVPDVFMPDFLTVTPEQDPTIGRVRDVPMQSKTVEFPARTDKNHATSATGGITVGRRTETQAAASSRMQTETVKLEATSLDALVYVTDELLQDSPLSVLALIQQAVRDEFVVKRLQEKIRGTGAGEPEGILNSPALVSVTRSANALGGDLAEMRARCTNYGNAIWICNHASYESILRAVTFDEGDTPINVRFLYSAGASIPGTNVNESLDRPETLMGRPIYWSEYASAPASAGDIILADWSQYLYGTRVGGPQFASSMHVRFVNHEQTLRFTERTDGRGWWRSPVTPQQATTVTRSPFITIGS